MRPLRVKETARQLIDQLPDNASWDDVVYEMVVRREIEKGLIDSEDGRTIPVEEVLREFCVDEWKSIGRIGPGSDFTVFTITSPLTDAPAAARQIVRKILLCSQQLGELPYSGRQVPEYRQEDIREILERPYRIIYRITTGQIDVLTVMHYRQLLPEDSQKL